MKFMVDMAQYLRRACPSSRLAMPSLVFVFTLLSLFSQGLMAEEKMHKEVEASELSAALENLETKYTDYSNRATAWPKDWPPKKSSAWRRCLKRIGPKPLGKWHNQERG